MTIALTRYARYGAAFLALCALPSPALSLTGTQLHAACVEKSLGEDGDRFCQAYLRGFIDGLIIGAFSPGKYCPPDDGVAFPVARSIIETYLKTHPDELDQEAATLAAEAMFNAYRCR